MSALAAVGLAWTALNLAVVVVCLFRLRATRQMRELRADADLLHAVRLHERTVGRR